ncbi:hypothetical protein AUK41_01435 [Candidatus Berkelbacteria bacterium CG2_30_43_20]|nr:MAG: hypothetical protein AUK41_01435 [Candidatus Berkelbacteria bacterium CG2_30_43_20]
MYTVYILRSMITRKYYIGVTSDITQRLRHHNSGANRSTKNGKPWIVVRKEDFSNSRDAWLRERQIKKYKGGEAFKKLIDLGEVA